MNKLVRERDGAVERWSLNNPANRNALDEEIVDGLLTACADATKDPRIWAYGFRNPFRWGFRPSNGSLYVADVGESSREEIDVVTALRSTRAPVRPT